MYGAVFFHYTFKLSKKKRNGIKETGVSLAFTVRALDTGPVIACERVEVDDQIKVCFSGITTLVMDHIYAWVLGFS